MTNQAKQLSKINSLIVSESSKRSIILRGFDDINSLDVVDNVDISYRKSREVYDRLTDDGILTWFGFEKRNQPLSEVLFTFQKLADQGYGKAYFPLFRLYGGEQGVDKDEKKKNQYLELALTFLEKNCCLQDVEIWRDLANLYLITDWNNEKIREKAISLIEKAADIGDIKSMWHLVAYYNQLQLFDIALQWQIKAAMHGHKQAQIGLKERLIENDLVEAIEEAIFYIDPNEVNEMVYSWCVWTAEQGDDEAQFYLAGIYQYSKYSKDLDLQKAIYWYEKSAEGAKNVAYLEMATCYEELQQYKEAIDCYTKAITAGIPDRYLPGVFFTVAQFYQKGLGVEKSLKKAIILYKKSYAMGNSRAAFEIGFIYQKAVNVENNYAKAMEWFRKSDDNSHNIHVGIARCKMANFYRDGLGVEQDYNKAINLYRSSDWLESALQLGNMYENAIGVDQDYKLALECYEKAFVSKVFKPKAFEAIEKLKRKLSLP